MNVGDTVTIVFVKAPSRERVEREARVLMARDERVQLRCTEQIPFPGVWDFRKLLPGQPVFLVREGEQFVGRWAAAAGRNLTLRGVRPVREEVRRDA